MKKKESRELNPNSRKATPWFSNDQYENLVGLGEFLYRLNPIIEFLELDKIFVDIFTAETELYFRFYDKGDYTTRVNEVYIISDLKDLYIEKILQNSSHSLDLYINHTVKGNSVQSKITLTDQGEIDTRNLNPKKFDSPFGRLMYMLKSAEDKILWSHPRYYDRSDELINESYDLLQLESTYETEFNSATEDLLRAQKLRPEFEKTEKCFIKSGEISHSVFIPRIGFSDYFQFFLAFRINEKLHFYLSPVANTILLPKANWISKTTCVIDLSYTLHYGDSIQQVKITLDESGIHTEKIE